MSLPAASSGEMMASSKAVSRDGRVWSECEIKSSPSQYTIWSLEEMWPSFFGDASAKSSAKSGGIGGFPGTSVLQISVSY
jgi:hypothetical protein